LRVWIALTLSTRNELVLGAAVEFLFQPAAEHRRDAGRQRDIKRERTDHDPGQQRGINEHHREKTKVKPRSITSVSAELVRKLRMFFEFSHPRHGIAGAAGLEIGNRQRNQMLEQPGAEFHIDPVGGVREHIGSERAEHGFEDRHRDEGRSPARRAW